MYVQAMYNRKLGFCFTYFLFLIGNNKRLFNRIRNNEKLVMTRKIS